MSTPRTLFDKLWDAHVVVPESDAAPAVLYIDLHLIHEVTSPQAFSELKSRGLKPRRPDRTKATMDHSTPTLPADADGKRGFVLTLQAREQHIRRERAASNVCSNEALCALAATIHLALLGPQGLREVAELSVDKAHRLAEKLAAVPGFRLRFAGPFFDEFALECPVPAERVRNALLKEGLLAGIPLGNYDPAWKNVLLVQQKIYFLVKG